MVWWKIPRGVPCYFFRRNPADGFSILVFPIWTDISYMGQPQAAPWIVPAPWLIVSSMSRAIVNFVKEECFVVIPSLLTDGG